MSTVDRVLGAVAENPRRFPIARASRRRALLGRFPYALIFEMLKPNGARIIACHHHRQSSRRWRVRERPRAYAAVLDPGLEQAARSALTP